MIAKTNEKNFKIDTKVGPDANEGIFQVSNCINIVGLIREIYGEFCIPLRHMISRSHFDCQLLG
jgi:hypothetical protein